MSNILFGIILLQSCVLLHRVVSCCKIKSYQMIHGSYGSQVKFSLFQHSFHDKYIINYTYNYRNSSESIKNEQTRLKRKKK